MKENLKLSEERIHLWLSRLLRDILGSRGYPDPEVEVFLRQVEELGMEQLYRRTVMEEFISANAGPLCEAAQPYIQGRTPGSSGSAGPGQGERPPGKGDLFFTRHDVERYITAALMQLTGDDPGLIMDSLAHDRGAWETIGERFASDLIRKITRYPPMGYSCRKFVHGFIAAPLRPGRHDLHPALSDILLEFAVPVIEGRRRSGVEEKRQLQERMNQLKAENSKLRRELKELKKKIRRENRETLKLDRQLRRTRKGLKTSGGETGEENSYMFG